MLICDDIFQYSVLIEYEPEQILVANVLVVRNFGPFKIGESFSLVEICFGTMQIKAMNNKKEVLKQCQMSLISK